MPIIQIKPLSVNKAWQGRRFKTEEYKKYENSVYRCLPAQDIPEGNLKLDIEVGFSNMSSDLDNVFKPFLDILQKRYGFNDSRIVETHAHKKRARKNREYIRFHIGGVDEDTPK